MVKKKKFKPPEDDFDMDEFKRHQVIISDKSKAILEKYRKWWDCKKRCWKDNFPGHGF